MASRGGVHALTVSWAAELARFGIRVNTLADAAIFLARASFVSGTVLEVDGGYAHGR
jgi:NAD(P)-dependent dehydrogenase (short-subunit alcohol dehydrogenase family)